MHHFTSRHLRNSSAISPELLKSNDFILFPKVAVAKIIKPKIVNVEVADKDKSKEKKKKPATDAQSRREELLKQLKAVEDAITRKRTKLEK